VNDFKEKVNELKALLHVTKDAELADKMGVKLPTISTWKQRGLSKEAQLAFSKIKHQLIQNERHGVAPPLHVNAIPLYPSLKASCSCGSVVCNCDNLESEPIQLPQEYIRECLGIHSTHGVHAIIADGESMEPTIKHGDIIFVSPCEAIKDGKVYIININDETYCKRVYKDLETGGLILRSDNPVAPEIKLSTSRILEMKIIGRVGVVLSRVVL